MAVLCRLLSTCWAVCWTRQSSSGVHQTSCRCALSLCGDSRGGGLLMARCDMLFEPTQHGPCSGVVCRCFLRPITYHLPPTSISPAFSSYCLHLHATPTSSEHRHCMSAPATTWSLTGEWRFSTRASLCCRACLTCLGTTSQTHTGEGRRVTVVLAA